MLIKFALLSGYLLSALSVLAVPSSLPGDLTVLRREPGQLGRNENLGRQDHPDLLAAEIEKNLNWTGAALRKAQGSITQVRGRLTVPDVYYPKHKKHHGGGAVGIGIDTLSGCDSSFFVGVILDVGGERPNNTAFYEWGSFGKYPAFDVNVGDVISLQITVVNSTSVSFHIQNDAFRPPKFVDRSFGAPPGYSLCMQEAVWGLVLLSDYVLADFQTLYIDLAYAYYGENSQYTWTDATPVDLWNFDKVNTYSVHSVLGVSDLPSGGGSVAMTRRPGV